MDNGVPHYSGHEPSVSDTFQDTHHHWQYPDGSLEESLAVNYEVRPYSLSLVPMTTWYRVLSVHTAESEGYILLSQLLEQGLVSCDMEPWKLFNTVFNLPTRCVCVC